MFGHGHGGRGSDHPPPRPWCVSIKDTEVLLTKGVDNSAGGGELLCSKHKFQGVSLKKKTLKRWSIPFCESQSQHSFWHTDVNTTERTPVYGDSKNCLTGMVPGSRPLPKKSIWFQTSWRFPFCDTLTKTCLCGRSGAMKFEAISPLWKSGQPFLQGCYTPAPNWLSTRGHTVREPHQRGGGKSTLWDDLVPHL